MNSETKVLILGIGGQDGSYLADILLNKGYEVHGLYRHSSVSNLCRIEHIKDQVVLHKGDVLDFESVAKIIRKVQPSYIYNEADQDNVSWSYSIPTYTDLITYSFPKNLLKYLYDNESIHCKLFLPLSATMFGTSTEAPKDYIATPPQNEQSPVNPISPYAKAKYHVYKDMGYYRQRGVPVYGGILFNHDSPRRQKDYLLQTIRRQALDVEDDLTDAIYLGNLDTIVDVGYAFEYMRHAVKIMELEKPDDFVIGTGVGKTIGELAKYALELCGISPPLEPFIKTNTEYYREDVGIPLIADCTKLENAVGSKPTMDSRMLLRLLLAG